MKKLYPLIALLCTISATAQIQPINEFAQGTIYPIPSIFTIDGTPYVSIGTYSNNSSESSSHVMVLNEDLQLVDNYTLYKGSYESGGYTRYVNNIKLSIYNFNSELPHSESSEYYLTQTLFNNDNNFEYIKPVVEIQNGNTQYTHLLIVSTNGTIIDTLDPFDSTYVFGTSNHQVWIMGENIYLITLQKQPGVNNSNRFVAYRIIRETSSIQMVNTDLPIIAYPSIVDSESVITIELGETNNASEITVINMMGQILKRIPITEGQRDIKIPAYYLDKGVNLLNTSTHKGSGSVKVIVQ